MITKFIERHFNESFCVFDFEECLDNFPKWNTHYKG